MCVFDFECIVNRTKNSCPCIVHSVEFVESLAISYTCNRRFSTEEEEAFSRRGTIKMLLMEQQVINS
jgi:hypothetical protein